MNILTDALPVSVEVNHTEYKIETDFRACLKIILAFEDNELTSYEKQEILLSIMYPKLPSDLRGALEQANWFLNGGKTSENMDTLRVYSFATDANFIFSAFKQTHNIDLSSVSLHWWVFLALFMDLGSETTFCNLVSLRKRVKTGKASKEERATARELGELFDVPEADDRTLEEKEVERKFLELVSKGKGK